MALSLFRCLFLLLYFVSLPTFGYGWEMIPNTKLRDVCPPNDFGGVKYPFSSSCKAVTEAWGGAAYSENRNTMYIWGGGHGDYVGNEIYALDLNTNEMKRLNNPTIPYGNRDKCEEELTPYDGTVPNSRHTYDGLVFIEHADRMLAFGGSLSCRGGQSSGGMWIFNPGDSSWRRIYPHGIDKMSKSYGITMDYDANAQKVYIQDRFALWEFVYNSGDGVLKKIGTDNWNTIHMNGVWDPLRKHFIMLGKKQDYYYDLNEKGLLIKKNYGSKGGESLLSLQSPGFDYDPVNDRFVAWGNKGDIFFLDPKTKIWSSIKFSGGPEPIPQGTNGRFAYVPKLKKFIAYGSVDDNAYLFSPLPKKFRDTQAPTSVGNLKAEILLPSMIKLSWNHATDNLGIKGYKVFKDKKLILDSNQLEYRIANLKPGSEYTFTVIAYDSFNNKGARSSVHIIMPVSKIRLPLGNCTLEGSLQKRKDIVFCEPWEDENWWKKGYDNESSTIRRQPATAKNVSQTEITDKGCLAGKCLKVIMKKGKSGALSLYWKLENADLAPDEIFLRYYLKLGKGFDPFMCSEDGTVTGSGGKFIGIADPRAWNDKVGQCGNGGVASDGINCWSARGGYAAPNFDKGVCSNKPSTVVRLYQYFYHPQKSRYGDSAWYDNYSWANEGLIQCSKNSAIVHCGIGSGGCITDDKWYLIEQRVKMNTPSKEDGVLQVWVNGVLSYDKQNTVFRWPGHDALHARLIWLNIFKGGTIPNCIDSSVYMDQMVISTEKRVGKYRPPSRKFKKIEN